MITYSPPIEDGSESPYFSGFSRGTFSTLQPSFPGPIPFAPLGPFCGTIRAVQSVVPGWGENSFTLPAAPPPSRGRGKQGGIQFSVQRQHSSPEPAADQRVGNRLRADTFLPIVQQQTISPVVVATAMYQPLDSPILRIGHMGYHRSCSSLRWVWPSLARRSAVFFKVSTALMSSRMARIFR